VTVTATIVGVGSNGSISTPKVNLNSFCGKAGTFTSPLSETNPNGDFPTFTFTAEWALSADGE
jgi:hypothetical protein